MTYFFEPAGLNTLATGLLLCLQGEIKGAVPRQWDRSPHSSSTTRHDGQSQSQPLGELRREAHPHGITPAAAVTCDLDNNLPFVVGLRQDEAGFLRDPCSVCIR